MEIHKYKYRYEYHYTSTCTNTPEQIQEQVKVLKCMYKPISVPPNEYRYMQPKERSIDTQISTSRSILIILHYTHKRNYMYMYSYMHI